MVDAFIVLLLVVADFGGDVNKSLVEQFREVRDKLDKKWPNSKYIAYFQAHTNTYAPVSVFKRKI